MKKLTDRQLVKRYQELAAHVVSVARQDEAKKLEVHATLNNPAFREAKAAESACYAEIKRRKLEAFV